MPTGPTESTFDIIRTSEVFNFLLENDFLTLPNDHIFPIKEGMKGKDYFKYHHAWIHPTKACCTFKNVIQDKIKKGIIEPPKEAMIVDKNPFPVVGLVNIDTIDTRS